MNQFLEWLLEMEYLDSEDIDMDGEEMERDLAKIKEVAPKFYNLLMSISNLKGD